ncbi:MAG: DNA phosphorothioation-dependent restriction protein DptG [Prevotella sp.]|nr:DNA phosphorothioation-dependent restriction protein DptG [Prevotella sp.]
MKIDLEAYNEHYHQGGKFIDNWQEGIKLLPFNSNPASAYDKKCGLHGTTGEFFRLWDNDGTKPIEDFEKSAVEPVKEYLVNQKQMPTTQVPEFVRMMRDIMFVNGNLNITDSAFIKYLPLVPNDERISMKDRKKYNDGQRKLANYLYSMLSDEMQISGHSNTPNLFSKILQEALTPFCGFSDDSKERDYIVLPYIKKSFEEDLCWMLEQEESVKVKYLHLLLHFYACYAVTQAIVRITAKDKQSEDEPAPFYFILNSERASVNHDAVARGWSYQIPKSSLDKLYGKSQALDILNSVLGSNVGFYNNIRKVLYQTDFEDNRELCNKLLSKYQEEKREVFNRRSSESGSIEEIEIDVHSYDEFISTLELLCTGLQSPSYISRMRKKVIDLLSVRFLQSRRGNFVLVLDNEMLTFLVALFTKSKKTKLENLYKLFNKYGIYFNRGSRLAIEEYLLKLNLLDRKSDSGEAQYVTVIL